MKNKFFSLLLIPFCLSGCVEVTKIPNKLKTGVFESERLVIFNPGNVPVTEPFPFPTEDEAKEMDVDPIVEKVKLTCQIITKKEYQQLNGKNSFRAPTGSNNDYFFIKHRYYQISFEIKYANDLDYSHIDIGYVGADIHYEAQQELILYENKPELGVQTKYLAKTNYKIDTSFDYIFCVIGQANFAYLNKIED